MSAALLQVSERAWSRLETATGPLRYAALFASGALSVAAFAPFHFWPMLFLSYPVLAARLDGILSRSASRSAKLKGAALDGWWFGFGFFSFGLYWIGAAFLVEAEKFAWAMPFAVTLMPAGLALFFASAMAAAMLVWRTGPSRLIVLAVSFSVFEWLRGHVLTGFPWSVPGYALTYPLPLMQGASLVGVHGLTPWAVLVFSAPLTLAVDASRAGETGRRSLLAAALSIAVLPIASLYAYGIAHLADGPAPMVEGVHVRIVQPSVPQREKWLSEKQGEIFTLHLDLSRTSAKGERDNLKGISHLVWPEAAMPFLPLEHPEALEAISGLLSNGTYLLSGGLRVAKDPGEERLPPSRRRVYNSLMVFGPTGGLTAVYDKIHLVPFGEYLPLRWLLDVTGLGAMSNIRGGLSPGESPRPLLDVPGLPPVGALVCYEAIFPAEVVQNGLRPGLLVNVTNDGWFGDSIGPYQHFHSARVRAVEEGLPMLRAANNGISAVIDSEGRILNRLGLNERGVIDSVLPAPRPPTPYARWGDVMLFAEILALALLAALWPRCRATH